MYSRLRWLLGYKDPSTQVILTPSTAAQPDTTKSSTLQTLSHLSAVASTEQPAATTSDAPAASNASVASDAPTMQANPAFALAATVDDGYPVIESAPPAPGQDALSHYEQDLQETKTALQISLDKWKALKEEVISDDNTLRHHASPVIQPAQSAVISLNAFIAYLFGKIKNAAQPANLELRELLETTHRQVQGLCKHLDVACAAATDPSNSEADQRKFSLDICNLSIEMTNDLIALIENVQQEIKHCLEFEKVTEQAAKQLVVFLLTLITGMPVPEIDYSFNPAYRNFLYNEIETEKSKMDIFETDKLGELRKAMKLIRTEEIVWQDNAKRRASQSSSTRIGNLALMPAPTAQPDVAANAEPVRPAVGVRQ